MVHDTERRPQCLNTYTLYLKYNLIIGITVNLEESFNAIRTCILRELSLFYFNPMKLMSIPQFIKDLVNILEEKNLSKDFKKKMVFQKNAQREVKDPAKSNEKYAKEYRAKCTPREEEKIIQHELQNMALNLANSPFLEIESQYIIDNPEIRKAIRKAHKQVCGACMSVNCRLKQMISTKLELCELKTHSRCEGSPKLRFMDIRTKDLGAASAEASAPTEAPEASAAS